MLLPASMDFLSRSDAEYLRLAIRRCLPPVRVTQDGLVGAENQIRGPQSMSGAFWGAVAWSDSIRQPTGPHSMLGGRGTNCGNLLIYKAERQKRLKC
jgi:hypothetical protein